MKITLRFIGLGINDSYQARVKIYDINHNLIKDEYTYNGKINFYGKNKRLYLIKVNFLNIIMSIPLYINNKYKFELILNSIYDVKNSKSITFLLTDANYFGLKIQKGEIIYE